MIFIEGHKTKKRPCPWSLEEKNAVLRHFTSHISLAKIPKKDEAEECLKKEKMLQERTWRNIKDFVRNTITSRKKKTVDVF